MKILKKIALLAVSAFAMTACVDPEPEIHDFPDPDVNFTFNVADSTYIVDYYVVSNIQFNNTSAKTGNVIWNFGVTEDKYDVVDMSDINHPIIKYKEAGRYNVTLTIEGVGSKTYPILISDIVPIMSIVSQSDSIMLNDKSTVELGLELPNPQNKIVKYRWVFPEGTTNANGEEMTVFEATSDEFGNVELPGVLKFKHIGSQRIVIESWYDIVDGGENRRLDDAIFNVQVGYQKPVPTLYYAQKDGNIKAIKLIKQFDLDKGKYKVFPYDMGVKSGSKPLNLCVGTDSLKQTWVYILDAGKQYYYIDDSSDNLGDGKITAMGLDGSNVNTVVSNEGQAAFMDPYRGFVVAPNLYYSDRNNGVTAIDLATRGAVEGQNEDDASFRESYVFTNYRIPRKVSSPAYGAVTAGLYRDKNGVWWWAKNYNGNGIWRFTLDEVSKDDATALTKQPTYPKLFDGLKVSTINIDEKRNILYVWGIGSNNMGLSSYDLTNPGFAAGAADTSLPDIVKSAITRVELEADPENTTADEQIHTTQLAVDSETGFVYFAFRNADGGTNQGLHSGIVYYDPATKKCYQYGETSDLGFGIVINPTKSNLF